MERPSSIIVLAQRILEEAGKIEGTSYDEISTRQLIEATQELQISVLTAPQLLEQHQIHYQSLSCLGWLVEFDIFNHVPIDFSPITYENLAAKANVSMRRLQSITRMAIVANGLFAEPSATQITHSRMSASIAADNSLQEWVRFMTRYSAPMANSFAEATVRWGETTAKQETAFNVAFRTDLPFFDYVKHNTGVANMFAGYMRAMGRSESGRLQHLVDGFDWGSLGDAHVIDVGGSTAQAAAALASAFPRLRFIVQDLPEVVEGGPAALAQLVNDEDTVSRIRFTAHDFFKPQPPADVEIDIFLLRKILHDWPASLAQQILQHLAVSLLRSDNPRARLIIMDTILPPSGSLGRIQEAGLRVRDLTMAEAFNSHERELAEWEQLFSSTTPRLKLVSWKNPAGSSMAVMDVRLDRQE